MNLASIDALLFDLGNVVIRIDFERAFAHRAAHAGGDAARLRENSRTTSLISAMSAARSKRRPTSKACAIRWASPRGCAAPRRVECHFRRGDPRHERASGARCAKIPVYAFTNTNRAHAAQCSRQFAPVLGHFRKVFASHEMGLRKPEPAAFAHIVKETGVPAERILFFDDSLGHVEAARACGLQAVHVTSDDDGEGSGRGVGAARTVLAIRQQPSFDAVGRQFAPEDVGKAGCC